MRGHPVEQHPDPLLVQVIDKVLEIFWRAKAAGWGIIASYLVPPGAIIGILCNRKQLYMGESCLFDISRQRMSQFAIGHEARLPWDIFSLSLKDMTPRARMDLVDGHWLCQGLTTGSLLHPCLILPLVTMNICDDAGGIWSQLKSKPVRIGLFRLVVVGF